MSKPFRRVPRKFRPLRDGKVYSLGVQTSAFGGSLPARASDGVPSRFRARMRYTTDPDVTVRALWSEEFRDDVSLKVFREWADEDEWNRHRKEFWDAASRRVLHRVMDDVVQAEAQEVVSMQEVVHGMIARLKPIGRDKDGIPVFRDSVSSVDKLAQALTKLEERLSKKRRGAVDLARDVTGGAPVEASAPSQALDISDDDIAKLAGSILQDRLLGKETKDDTDNPPAGTPQDSDSPGDGTAIELPDEDEGEDNVVRRPEDDRATAVDGVGDAQNGDRPPPVE